MDKNGNKKPSYNIRFGVMAIPSIVFAIVIIIGIVNNDAFVSALWSVFMWLMNNIGWGIELGCLGFVIFLLVLWIHPIGKIKFGGKDAKPKFSTWNWWAISLCAGIGTGIVFWGPVEPLIHSFEPATATGLKSGSNEAIIWAMTKTYLHWSLTPYSIYVIFAVVLGFAIYNMNKPYAVSSGLSLLTENKDKLNKLDGIVDTLTLFAIVGGVSGSLGYGLLQIGSGLQNVFGLSTGPILWIAIAVVIVITYCLSSLSGLDKGIRWLSDKNAWMFIVLLVFILVLGPTSYIFKITTQALGSFVNNFIELSTYTAPFANNTDSWPQWWDMYWFADWLAFGPITGLFLIKLCYGRTIREFITINLLLPAGFAIIWFGVFGGTALNLQISQGVDLVGYIAKYGNEALMLRVLDEFPLAFLIKPFMLLLVALSFVTLADSMTSTISLMSIRSKDHIEEAPMKIKLFWGILMGATSVIFVICGGIEGVKVVKTIAGIPILFLGIVMVFAFIRYFAKGGVEYIEKSEEDTGMIQKMAIDEEISQVDK